MDYYDEWRLDLLPEEELNIIYADWESWFEAEDEHLTIAICLECGNALNRWTNYHDPSLLFCGVCH